MQKEKKYDKKGKNEWTMRYKQYWWWKRND